MYITSGGALGHNRYDGYESTYCCVRPIVCLKSEVKLQRNESKSKDGRIVYDLV